MGGWESWLQLREQLVVEQRQEAVVGEPWSTWCVWPLRGATPGVCEPLVCVATAADVLLDVDRLWNEPCESRSRFLSVRNRINVDVLDPVRRRRPDAEPIGHVVSRDQRAA